jgi:serine protease DegQ
MFKKVWLGLAQIITVLVMMAFVIVTLKPQWMPVGLSRLTNTQSKVATAPADPQANLTFKQAPANLAGLSYNEAVSKAIPSVVRIYTTTNATVGGTVGGTVGSDKESGSGVIIDAQGYIVTNQHVIEGATQIQVVLNDDRNTSAKLVGIDPDNDIAVLKIDLDNLVPIIMGREDELRVGDVVLAIGNPFDVGQSVSMGIVSALHRTQMGANTFENFIQTDAAINPGNSGGALINSNGYLVGINEFIINCVNDSCVGNTNNKSFGVGFAIPVSTMQQVAQELIKTGKVSRGHIGIASQDITPQVAKAFNLASADGVIVSSVTPSGPAAQAGIQVGDILMMINDARITNVVSMVNEIAKLKPGSSARITLQRNGQEILLPVTIGERPTANPQPN